MNYQRIGLWARGIVRDRSIKKITGKVRFLSYLMTCTITGKNYQIYGYKGKQVRDNIHSYDLVNAFYHFYQAPRIAEVYNIGGSRFSNCSMLEAIQHCEAIAEKNLN